MQMTTLIALPALLFALSEAGNAGRAEGGGPQDRKSRPFDMGVGLIPHDMSEEGIQGLTKFVQDNADLVAHKVDGGVPWAEALAQKGYDPEFEKNLEGKANFVAKKVFLALTPLDGEKAGLAGSRGLKENQPDPFANREFDDPQVVRAYVNYCRDLIRRLKPHYFAYALEVNQLAGKNPNKWKKFLTLAREVYVTLKKENRELPIFVTFSVEAYYDGESNHRKAIKDVMAFSDLVGLATIPFYFHANPAKIPKDYFSRITGLAKEKPVAFVETGFLAQDLILPGLGERYGKVAWQDDYLKLVFEESLRLNGKFIVWMVARDPDALWERFAKGGGEMEGAAAMFKLFRDTGLLDGEGKPRKAFDTWSAWFKLPKK